MEYVKPTLVFIENRFLQMILQKIKLVNATFLFFLHLIDK
jgi:hypothetical protein